MKTFSDKTPEDVLKKCDEFIQKYEKSVGDFEICKRAWELIDELIQSQINSHSDLDETVNIDGKRIMDIPSKVVKNEEANRQSYSLRLDALAWALLQKLVEIAKKNEPPRNKQ